LGVGVRVVALVAWLCLLFWAAAAGVLSLLLVAGVELRRLVLRP